MASTPGPISLLPRLFLFCILFCLVCGYLLSMDLGKSSLRLVSNPSKERRIHITTAYLDLGSFRKGGGNRTKSQYEEWMLRYEKISNPVYFYSDNKTFVEKFKRIRKKFGFETKSRLVDRKNLWGFMQESKIAKIFHRSGYPKHHPNTVFPAYAAAMIAKLDLLEITIETHDLGDDEYIAWVDLGQFRNYPMKETCFEMKKPPKFEENSVAFLQIEPLANSSCIQIIQRNTNWVGGTLFVGKIQVVKNFISKTKEAISVLLQKQWISIDQQTYHCMYADPEFVNLTNDSLPKIQIYHREEYGKVDLNLDYWFYLGYLMRAPHSCNITI